MSLFRFMIVDDDGQRVGRFETSEIDWQRGDVFDLDEKRWRIAEILPEVSTMVAYNAVWVATPAPATDEDEQATHPGGPVPEAIARVRI